MVGGRWFSWSVVSGLLVSGRWHLWSVVSGLLVGVRWFHGRWSLVGNCHGRW